MASPWKFVHSYISRRNIFSSELEYETNCWFDNADMIVSATFGKNKHKEIALQWMQCINVEKSLDHNVFMIVMEYMGISKLVEHIENICITPITFYKIVGSTPLVFCESLDETIKLVAQSDVKKGMSVYHMLAIAHMIYPKVCPWAPLHFNVSDDKFMSLVCSQLQQDKPTPQLESARSSSFAWPQPLIYTGRMR